MAGSPSLIAKVVLGIALHDAGDLLGGIDVLKRALAHAPYDRELRLALASYEAEAGRRESATERFELLRQLEPEWLGL